MRYNQLYTELRYFFEVKCRHFNLTFIRERYPYFNHYCPLAIANSLHLVFHQGSELLNDLYALDPTIKDAEWTEENIATVFPLIFETKIFKKTFSEQHQLYPFYPTSVTDKVTNQEFFAILREHPTTYDFICEYNLSVKGLSGDEMDEHILYNIIRNSDFDSHVDGHLYQDIHYVALETRVESQNPYEFDLDRTIRDVVAVYMDIKNNCDTEQTNPRLPLYIQSSVARRYINKDYRKMAAIKIRNMLNY